MVKLVIIGLGTAGFAAALAAKKQDRSAEITIIDKKDFDLLHVCGLPYVLERKLHSFAGLKHDINAGMMGIKVIGSCIAKKIIHEEKQVYYENIQTKEISSIPYNTVIIAVGSYAFIPPLSGVENNPHIFTVDTLENSEKLDKAVQEAKSAAIIGAGAIGVEIAYALRNRGLNVCLIEMIPAVYPRSLDPDMSQKVESFLKDKGISLLLGKKLEKIEGSTIFIETEKIKADIIVMATGVRPCIKLAGDSGLATDKGGIIVNDKLQTSVPEVYAAGDSITLPSLITKKQMPSLLATTAYKQGTVAGTNAAGGNASIKGTLGTFVSVAGDMEVASTGFNTHAAAQNNFEIVIGKATGSTLPEYMPDGKEITVKIIADKKTGKILGAQAIGQGAAARINVVSTAMLAGMTLNELSNVELAYCPPISQTYDVLLSAVDIAIRKL